jgi:RHS repeat-associated protein
MSSGTFATGTRSYSFVYNAQGQRVTSSYKFLEGTSLTPIQTGEAIEYTTSYRYDHFGRLHSESTTRKLYGIGIDTSKIEYLYDESGVVGFKYTSAGVTTPYYYRRNLQGDVIEIYDTGNSRVVRYDYDAWGNCTIASGTTDQVIARANPIRYRGYYYDVETELYYLNARYYSPIWRRFISPDSTEYIDSENPNGLNLYAYCNNDPVNYVDPSGRFAISATFGIGALIAITVTSMIIGGVVQLTSNALAGETGSDLWRGVAGAAFGTGANALVLCLAMPTGGASLFIAAGVSTVVQTGVDTIETLIRKEKVGWNVLLDLGLNFATTLAGNYLGGKLVPINSGWTKPQWFKSIFIRPFGQKILAQTAIGARLSGTVNFIRKYDWSIFESILSAYTVPLYQKDYTGWK